jgi:hypothetical protein
MERDTLGVLFGQYRPAFEVEYLMILVHRLTSRSHILHIEFFFSIFFFQHMGSDWQLCHAFHFYSCKSFGNPSFRPL